MSSIQLLCCSSTDRLCDPHTSRPLFCLQVDEGQLGEAGKNWPRPPAPALDPKKDSLGEWWAPGRLVMGALDCCKSGADWHLRSARTSTALRLLLPLARLLPS